MLGGCVLISQDLLLTCFARNAGLGRGEECGCSCRSNSGMVISCRLRMLANAAVAILLVIDIIDCDTLS